MTTRSKHKTTTGFTLLEILVVLIIMGVVFSLMSLSIGAKPSRIKQTATHLQQLLSFAHEDAMLKGQVIGWKLSDSKHSFYRYHQQHWEIITDERLLHDYPLLAEVDYQLTVQDIKTETKLEGLPQLLLLPDGTLTDFNLHIQAVHDNEEYRLFSDQDEIKLEKME